MHCWARYLFIAVVSLLGLGQMMAACGQKGDLYLPEPKPQASETGALRPQDDQVANPNGDAPGQSQGPRPDGT